MNHLDPKTAEIAQMSNSDRIRHLKNNFWIMYPRAKVILSKMMEQLEESDPSSPQRIAIIGHTGNGKTYLINHFLNLAERKYRDLNPNESLPILRIQHPASPNEGRLYNTILSTSATPYRESETAARKQSQVIRVIERLKIKLIIMDDAHDANNGSKDSQKQYLAVLRNLMETTRISFVLAGTEKLLPLLDYDEQMRRRVDLYELPRWVTDKTFRTLLNSFELKIPLRKPSHLSELKTAEYICNMCDGLIDPLWKLLTAATIHAINTGHERIDYRMIEECGWALPRDKMIEVGKRLR